MLTRGKFCAVGVAVLLVALTGCATRADRGPDDTAPRVSTVEPTPSSAAPSAGDPAVTLLEPGAEPRQPLRFAVAAGSRARTTMIDRTTVELTVDGRPGPDTLAPQVQNDVLVTADSVAPDGEITGHYTFDRFRISGGGLTGQARTAAQRSMSQLDGLTGTFVVSARGESISADITVPPGLDPKTTSQVEDLSTQLKSLTIPFPDEPVGVGGRWTARTDVTVTGIDSTVEYTYTLRERTGSDYVIDATYQQGGGLQVDVELPGLPADSTADVNKIAISGTSTSRGSLSQLLPATASGQGSGTVDLTFSNATQRSDISQALDITVQLRPSR